MISIIEYGNEKRIGAVYPTGGRIEIKWLAEDASIIHLGGGDRINVSISVMANHFEIGTPGFRCI